MRAFAPNSFVAPLAKTIATFHHFHPLVEVDFPPFVNDFHLEIDCILDRNTFIFISTRSPCFSFGSPSGMVYEFLRDYFVFDNYVNDFDLFLKICRHITHDHVLPLLSCMLVASQLLALEKQTKSIQAIAIREVIYQLVTHTLSI